MKHLAAYSLLVLSGKANPSKSLGPSADLPSRPLSNPFRV